MPIEKKTKLDLETFLQRRMKKEHGLRDFLKIAVEGCGNGRSHVAKLLDDLSKDFDYDRGKINSIIKDILAHDQDKVSKNEVNATIESPSGNDDLQKTETAEEVSQITYYDSVEESNAEISNSSPSPKKRSNKKTKNSEQEDNG